MKLLLSGGTICTFDADQTVVSPGVLGIEDGRIVFVGQTVPSNFSADRTIDCEGRILFPGFVNAHVHLGEHLFRGWMDEADFEGLFYSLLFAWEAALDPTSVYWGSLAASAEALLNGVTTVADMYHHAEATARAVEQSGIRACLGQTILGFSLERPPRMTPAGIDYRFDEQAFEEQLHSACRFADQWRGAAEGRITTALAPHATNTLNKVMLESIADEAYSRSTLIHMHLAQMKSEFADVQKRDGVGCVELLAQTGVLKNHFIGAHAIFLSPGEETVLKTHRAAVAHNPIANAKDAGLIAPIQRLCAAGVPIGLGTDAFRMDLLEVARFAACLHRVHAGDAAICPAREVLTWATLGGAQALGMEDEIGSLEVGKRGDVVVFDACHLNTLPSKDPFTTILYYGGASNIRLVLVAGRLVVEDGELLTLDLTAVKSGFKQAAQELRNRLIEEKVNRCS